MNENVEEGQVAAVDLAQYILKHHAPLSPLKLQFLLFFCEGYHLSVFEKSLFEEEFEAWIPGPVCIEVARKYKYSTMLPADLNYRAEDTDPDEQLQKTLNEDQIDLLQQVLAELGVWREIELQTFVKDAKPWKDARTGYAEDEHCDVIIAKSAMLEFYKTEMGF